MLKARRATRSTGWYPNELDRTAASAGVDVRHRPVGQPAGARWPLEPTGEPIVATDCLDDGPRRRAADAADRQLRRRASRRSSAR